MRQKRKAQDEFAKRFILLFIKEILRNISYSKYYYKTKKEFGKSNQIEKKQKNIITNEDIATIVHEKINAEQKKISELKKQEEGEGRYIKSLLRYPNTPGRLRYIKIPDLRLPETVSYLQPTPTPQYIDLGKLNPLIKDPLVKMIECFGPGENIVVSGLMGRKKTRIILSGEEINDIITRFSEATKIPVIQGIFRVAFGNLTLSAVISREIPESEFIIKKISQFPSQSSY